MGWQLEARLRMAFEDRPVEDGINHPAERIIDDALQSVDVQLHLEWLRTLSVDTGSPDLASSVLRCLGRQQPGTPAWRAEVVRAVLATDDVEMRDAAVQAAESWGGVEMRNALQSHHETVRWLHACVEDVLKEIEV